MPIPVKKLLLYIAGASIRPFPSASTLERTTKSSSMTRSISDSAKSASRTKRYVRHLSPNLMIQFEDSSTDNAFKYLERYRNKYAVLNDDIQGTGVVVLSGMQLMSFFTLQGLSVDEAREHIWLVDSQGLVFDARGKLAEHNKYFIRRNSPMTNLLEIIDYIKPTALLGLSTISDAFKASVIQAMAALNPRPIIFPLSNPVRLSECTFPVAVESTNGNVLFASGSPFDPVKYADKATTCLGLGCILARVSSVTDSMVEASSLGLADFLTYEERDMGLLSPALTKYVLAGSVYAPLADFALVREISTHIAKDVIRAAQKAMALGGLAARLVTVI
ncbi:NAD(P)-binding protein [Hymenopellis radicata]|nr:NAD(P)-binding protein [Hymenopellis radicata]